jgi:hypothetical protein
MTDRDIVDMIEQARACLEAVDAELVFRRNTDPVEGFKVWSSARLDSLSMVHGIKRLEQAFDAALRRRRRARRNNRERTSIRAEQRAS